jgi:hypothetical protein
MIGQELGRVSVVFGNKATLQDHDCLQVLRHNVAMFD